MRKFLLALLFMAPSHLLAVHPPTVRIKGIILYNRPAPVLPALKISRDQAHCGTQIPNETLLVHKKGGLQNVLVFIANIAPEKLPPLNMNLAIQACRLQPHVLALGVESQLTLRNNDEVLHNVHGQLRPFNSGWDKTSTLDIFRETEASYFNFAFPQKGNTAAQKLDRPGLIRLRSDIGHDWMSGYILVMPHRYFAVTEAEGKFELPELPAGRYDLVLWHETLGVKRQIVEVKTADKNGLLIKWFPEMTTATQADSVATN